MCSGVYHQLAIKEIVLWCLLHFFLLLIKLIVAAAKMFWTALLSNSIVLPLKVAVWYHSHSHVIFAEIAHSDADLMNQSLLGVGLHRSKKAPNASHP
ncbi:hypothetical protein Sjap_006368 [Stephania japonica]|uniref:Cation efflux protein transmembrane domain-containing protein n=1 Tax=Stephania japonica TaxID=461633 RepID=A0AAP0K6W3_9MAGN